MFRYEEDAEEVVREERAMKASPAKRRRNSKVVIGARAAKAQRSRDPLGPDAKNYNDEIPDPDFVIPE